MSHKIVRSLLETRLMAWAKARTPTLRVAYQGVVFEPLNGETYLLAFLMPSGTSSITLEGEDRIYAGIFQVSVVAPAGKGTGSAEGIAEELEQLFPNGLRLSTDRMELLTTNPAEPGPPVVSDSTLTVPVSLQYRAEKV